MKRVSFILVSLVILVSCVVFCASSASAASNVINPSSYDFNLKPLSGGDFQVDFGVSTSTYWERYLSGEVRYTNVGVGWNEQKSQERLLDNIYYKIYPLGQDNFVDLTGAKSLLPFEFKFSILGITDTTIQFDMVLEVGYDLLRPDGSIVTSTGNSVVRKSYNPILNIYVFSLEETPDSQILTDPVRIWYKFSFDNLSSQSSDVQITYNLLAGAEFSYVVNSSYGSYLQNVQNSNATNDKLDDMIGEQEDANNKLDEIINSSPEPAPPEGSDDVNNVIDTEDELLQDAIGNFDNNESVLDNGDVALRSFFPALEVVLRLLNLFLAIDFFKHLSFISLSLGVLVVLLNVGQSLLDRTDASARRSAAEQRRSKNSRSGSRNRGRGRRRGG